MKRVITYHITEAEAGISIADYLKRKGYSRQSIVALKKIPESILVDGRWEYVRYLLKAGELLVIQFAETDGSIQIEPVCLPFLVVYEDEDLLVVNKSAGMPIHPSMNNHDNTLANAAAWYFQEKNETFTYRCINRLDRDTSGLTILAKHFVSAGILYEQMARREIKREYLAIVEHGFSVKEGTIDKPIGRLSDSAIERCIDWEKGERAVTHYRVLTQSVDHAVVSLHLDTGRTHQIRVHMTDAGHPLVGDWLYGRSDSGMDRQALHSRALQFVHPITGKEIYLTAPIPEDMEQFIKRKALGYDL